MAPVSCSMSLLWCLLFDVFCIMSPVLCLLSYVSCLMYHVLRLLSHASCHLSHVSFLISPVSHLLSPVSHLLCHVSWPLSPVSRLIAVWDNGESNSAHGGRVIERKHLSTRPLSISCTYLPHSPHTSVVDSNSNFFLSLSFLSTCFCTLSPSLSAPLSLFTMVSDIFLM